MDIPNPRPQGIECPSLPLLLITSHLPIPHPSSFLSHISLPITLPSYCPFCALLPHHHPSPLSLLLNLPSLVSLSLSVSLPWPHLSSSCGSLSFSHSRLNKSPFLAPLLSSSHPYPLLLFLLSSPLSAAQVSSPMDQPSCQKPRGPHIDTTDIPIERSQSTLTLMRCMQL